MAGAQADGFARHCFGGGKTFGNEKIQGVRVLFDDKKGGPSAEMKMVERQEVIEYSRYFYFERQGF